MDSNVKEQAKKVIDTLYDWLFDGEGYTAPAPAGQCVKEYVDGDEVASGSIIHKVLNSLGNAKGRYASLQDHAVAVVTSAASAASTIVAEHGHIGAATTGIPGQSHVPRPSSTFFDNGRAASDSESLISFFRSFYDNPSAAFDDLLGHHYPHFDSLIARLGLDELAKSLNCDSRILFLACLLPLIVLLLSTCCIMGAGFSTEKPHAHGYHEHKKSDPTKVGGMGDSQGSSSSVSSHGTGSSSGPSSSSAKGGKGKGKKGGVRDDAGGPITEGSLPAGSYHVGDSNLSSWGSMIGATGFRGADVLDFKPFDIYDVIGSEKAQHDQDEVILDNQEDYVENISDFAHEFVSAAAARAKKLVHDIKETNTDNGPQKAHSQADTKGKQGGPAGPGSEPLLRTRIPRPHSFKEADRHRHQPHVPSSSFTSSSSSSSSSRQRQDGFGNAVDQGHGDRRASIAAKIMDFAQGNSIMKNMDGISGGVIGATLATVAVIANTAEAAATSLKENMPSSVSDFVNGLQESFNESMENGGLEGTGFDDQPRDSRVQISELPDETYPSRRADSGSPVSATKKGSSSSSGTSKAWPSSYGPMAGKGSKAAPATAAAPSTSVKVSKTGSAGTSDQANKGHAMAANPPRLRQRSVGHAQPAMAAASSAVASKSASSRPVEVAHTPKAETSGSHAHKSLRSHGISSAEDIGVGPKTKYAVYAEHIGKGPSESSGADPSASSLAFETVAGSGFDKRTKSTKHTYGASGSDTPKEPTDPKEVAHRAKMTAGGEEKGLKSGSSKSSVAPASGQKPSEKIAHTADKVSNDVKIAAGKAKNQAKSAERSIENVTKDIKKNVDKAVGKTNDSVASSIPSAQKTKDTIVHDAKEKVKEADATAKKVALDTKKTVEAGVSYAQIAKNTLVKDSQAVVHGAENAVENAVHSAESTVHKAAEVAKGTVNVGLASAHKTKDAAVARAQKLAEGAEHAAEAVVGQAKAVVNSAVETAQHAADIAVFTVQDTVLQADIALHDAADAAHKSMRRASDTAHHVADHAKVVVGSTIAVAKHDFEEAEHLAKEAVTSTLSAAQRTKGSVAHAAEDAVHEAEAILDTAVKQGQDNVGSFMTGTHATIDRVMADVKGAVKNAENNIDSTIASAQQAKNTLAADATKAANKASSDAKKAVASSSGAIREAEKKIESAAQKVKSDTSRAAKDIEKKVESTVKVASGTAQKVKNNATQADKDAEKKVKDTVQTATAATQKDLDTQAVKDIYKRTESAVDSAFNAASKAKFDVSYVDKEVEKSVASAKKTIEHGLQTSSSSSAHKAENASAKDLNKAADKAGQSTKVAEEDVESAIKAAMEYALKTANDAPIQSAKATLDSAIASAHKTENHIAQDLKNAAHKVESAAHKASYDAKATLGSALAAAHKAENNHSDAHPVHLDAHGGQSSALTSSGPAHLHHAEHTHEIKKAFVYGHNSPRVGNKETRFVGGSPPSGSSSDSKPELKAAYSAHHAHHDEATGDGTQEKLKTASDNHTGGEYSFFLNENDRLDLLDDANADDGGEEDSDEDDHHDQPGHGERGIPSAAPSIFQSAKTVASAVASRVATASHQGLDNARHRLSSLVDHMADNLAGHDELDDDDIDDEDEDHDSTSPTKTWSTTSGPSTSSTHHHHHQSHTQVHPHHHVTVEDVTDTLSDVADNDAAQSISHLVTGSSKTHTDTSLHSKDYKSHVDNKDKAQKDSGGAHAYKPVLTSTHVDMDGFIVVEASKAAHEHEAEHHGLSGHHRHHTPSSASSTKKHATSTAPPPTKSNSASSQPSSTIKPKQHSVAATGLSYSGVVQLHVNKNDHGAKIGITENRPTTTSTKSPSNSLFQSENYEQFVATTPLGDEIASVISHGGDQIMPVTLNAPPTTAHKERQQHAHVLAHHPHDTSVAPRRISIAAPTTTLTLEHGRGHLQGVEHTQEAHGGRKAGVEHGDDAKKQQLTVDAQGNKVPESDVRRDSGYDLLM
ncbi:hypothetical protein BG006_011434 [Podila minutissima]|uniref:Uncharacterized protein n=1 Tax=Podila minutissima TaxID=64525 RepID=A0A9P5SEI4_9FUNG|nr:hypothetical protein BG006_011434 [Podila minutissima]